MKRISFMLLGLVLVLILGSFVSCKPPVGLPDDTEQDGTQQDGTQNGGSQDDDPLPEVTQEEALEAVRMVQQLYSSVMTGTRPGVTVSWAPTTITFTNFNIQAFDDYYPYETISGKVVQGTATNCDVTLTGGKVVTLKYSYTVSTNKVNIIANGQEFKNITYTTF